MAIPADTMIVAGAAALGAYLGQQDAAKKLRAELRRQLEPLRAWADGLSAQMGVAKPLPPKDDAT